MKKIHLLINTCFPLIIFYSILLITDNSTLLIQSVFLYFAAQSFIIFKQRKDNLHNLILRILFSSILTLAVSLLTSYILENIVEITFKYDLRIGLVIGLVITTYFNTQILINDVENIEEQSWQFIDDDSFVSGKTLIKYWNIFIVCFTFLFIIIVQHFNYTNFLVAIFAILLVSGVLVAMKRRYFSQKIDTNDLLRRLFYYYLGCITLFISLLILLINILSFYSMIFFLVGILFIIRATIEEASYKQFRNVVFFPSLGMFFTVFLIFNMTSIFEQSNIYLLDKFPIQKQEITSKKQQIEYHLTELYNELDNLEIISKYIKPDFKVKINNDTYFWQEPNPNLEMTFSYEVIGKEFQDSINYFKKGKYHIQKEKGNVAYAVALTFKDAVEKYLLEYFQLDTKIEIELTGAADNLDIVKSIQYDSTYDKYFPNKGLKFECDNKPYLIPQGNLVYVNENCILAACRALALRDFIEKNIPLLKDKVEYLPLKTEYNKKNNGGAFRKVEIRMIIYNIISK